jgi:hypothetical protein
VGLAADDEDGATAVRSEARSPSATTPDNLRRGDIIGLMPTIPFIPFPRGNKVIIHVGNY